MKHRGTKATSIRADIKPIVWRRDMCKCVLCGSHNAGPHCHYIRRSQGGLGIPENLWTGCQACHEAFDSEASDGPLHQEVADHLRACYPDWDEIDKRYRKYR